MKNRVRLVLGSLLTCIGSTILGISVFKYSVLGSAIGILMFPTGYSVLGGEGKIVDLSSKKGIYKGVNGSKLLLLTPIIFGALVIGKGLTIGAQSIRTLEASGMIFSGILFVTGYIITHESYVRGFL